MTAERHDATIDRDADGWFAHCAPCRWVSGNTFESRDDAQEDADEHNRLMADDTDMLR